MDTSAHLEELRMLAEKAAAGPVDFMLVEDCAEWAATNGVKLTGNPSALAVKRRSDGLPTIVLRQTYDADHIARTASSLWAAGWSDQADEVKEPLACLRFLILHELAHLINNWGKSASRSAMNGRSTVWAG